MEAGILSFGRALAAHTDYWRLFIGDYYLSTNHGHISPLSTIKNQEIYV